MSAPATTCALVRISPSAVMINPVPDASPSRPSCTTMCWIATTLGPIAAATAATSSAPNGCSRAGAVSMPSVLAARGGWWLSSARYDPTSAPARPLVHATSTTMAPSTTPRRTLGGRGGGGGVHVAFGGGCGGVIGSGASGAEPAGRGPTCGGGGGGSGAARGRSSCSIRTVYRRGPRIRLAPAARGRTRRGAVPQDRPSWSARWPVELSSTGS